MIENNTSEISVQHISPRAKEFRRFIKVFFGRWLVGVSTVIILGFILTAIFAPWLAPYDPYEINYDKLLNPPNRENLLGTDTLGRDILSRIIYGSRVTLMVGVIALSIASTLGMVFGLIAGYFGGLTQNIIMRITDALMSFPMILLALVIAALLGGGLINVMIAIGISLIPGYIRMMCAQVYSVKENDYILAERSLGSSDLRIMLRHIFPNCFPPLMVMFTMQMGSTILTEASLSFLGIGIESPTAAWGGMINDGYPRLLSHPLLSFIPGVSIMLVVFAFNMVGDGIRDALDPKLRGTL